MKHSVTLALTTGALYKWHEHVTPAYKTLPSDSISQVCPGLTCKTFHQQEKCGACTIFSEQTHSTIKNSQTSLNTFYKLSLVCVLSAYFAISILGLNIH
jgi:hypothetical protein